MGKMNSIYISNNELRRNALYFMTKKKGET